MKLTERLADRIFPPLETATHECHSCNTLAVITDSPRRVTEFLTAQAKQHASH